MQINQKILCYLLILLSLIISAGVFYLVVFGICGKISELLTGQ